MNNALHWFRADLRISDNTALLAALEKSKNITTVFILTPETWEKHDFSPHKISLIHQNLKLLSEQLAKKNIHLIISHKNTFSDSTTALLELCEKHQITDLYFNKQYELDELRRDEEVVSNLSGFNINCHAFDDQAIVPPGKIKTLSGDSYKVFTPFKKAWLQEVNQNLYNYLPNQKIIFEKTTSQDNLKKFCDKTILNYAEYRDFPSLSGTSQLSAALAIGSLSPRECLSEVLKITRGDLFSQDKHPGALTWLSEIIWRDFYKHILFYYPHICKHQPFKENTDLLSWKNNPRLLSAWKNGQTGFPLVDAGMRQLNQTGWMHNRLRMVTAMFFTKTLFLDWRLGEKYFMQNLIDGDFSANNGGWQWCASTGTDAVPYFRIFNPTTQSERFDSTGEFIRQYCPELKSLSNKQIHDPYQRGVKPGEINYPEPIVDYKQMRAYVIEQFKKLSI